MSETTHGPRSTGEIISDAVWGLRRTFAVVFTLALPFCAVVMFLREAGLGFFLGVLGAFHDLTLIDSAAIMQALPAAGAGGGCFLAAFFTQLLLLGAITAVGDDVCHGRVPSVPSALSRLGERGAAIVVTGMLFMTLLFGAIAVVFAVPLVVSALVLGAIDHIEVMALGGVLGLVGAAALFIVLTLRWSLYGPAVIVEGRSFFAALARSAELTAGRGLPFFETPRFRLSVLLLVGLGLSGVLQSLFVGPRLLMAVLTGWSFSDGSFPGLAEMPLWFMLPFGLLEIVTNAAVVPFSGLLLCFFAFDLRVRYEGVST